MSQNCLKYLRVEFGLNGDDYSEEYFLGRQYKLGKPDNIFMACALKSMEKVAHKLELGPARCDLILHNQAMERPISEKDVLFLQEACEDKGELCFSCLDPEVLDLVFLSAFPALKIEIEYGDQSSPLPGMEANVPKFLASMQEVFFGVGHIDVIILLWPSMTLSVRNGFAKYHIRAQDDKNGQLTQAIEAYCKKRGLEILWPSCTRLTSLDVLSCSDVEGQSSCDESSDDE